MSAGCARCGDCCENIVLSGPDLAPWTTAALEGVPDPATDDGRAHWREHGWPDSRETAIRQYRPDGKFRANADFITAHWAKGENGRWSCDAFDPVARSCAAHDARPPVCRDYPWYGREPSAEQATVIGLQCSYLADLPAAERPEGSRPLIPLTVV